MFDFLKEAFAEARTRAGVILVVLVALVVCYACSGCAMRKPRPPTVSTVRAEQIVTEQAVHSEGARATLYHQGQTIQSVLTAAEEAQWALDAADRKNVIIEEHYRRRARAPR